MESQPSSSATASMQAYLWEVADKPVSIHLYFDVIDRMSPDVLRGLGALKRRGAEVGGILLGRIEPGTPQNVWIEDFEPIASEYLHGPSYKLSANDLEAFESAITRPRGASGKGLSVVGYYRSHTREDLFMDDEDLALAEKYFSDPGNVFLIVRPFAMRTSIAGFFIWEDGEIFRQSTYQQFPFQRRELGGGETRPQRADRPAPLPPPPLPAKPPAAKPPAVQPRQVTPVEATADQAPTFRQSSGLSILAHEPEQPRWSTIGREWLLPLVICVVVVAGYFGYRSVTLSRAQAVSQERPAETVALPLKLAVADKQDQLEVSWDRNAPAVAAASRGQLSITDGAVNRDLELSSAQLRNGRIVYSRLSGDVMLRLEVFPEGQESVSESIRILASDPAPAPRPKAPVTQNPPTTTRAEVPAETPAEPAPQRKAASRPRPPARVVTRRAEPAANPVEARPEPPPQPELELTRPERRR